MPAGTGVWVVNTVPARTSWSASANVRPSAMYVAMRSSPRKPACPSFMWNTSGAGTPDELGERAHGPRAADAEQQLLQQSVLSPAAVEPVGDRTQLVVVRRDVGVEHEQGDPADRRLPDARVQRSVVGQGERHLHGGAVGPPEHRERQPVGVEHRVALLLPAVGRDRLRKYPAL